MRACPYCAESIQEAARICRFCGRDVAASGSDQTRDSPFETKLARVLEAGLGLIAVAAVAYLVMTRLAPRSSDGETKLAESSATTPLPIDAPPLVLPLVDSTLVIYAGGHFDTSFTLDEDRPCILTGRIRGIEGGDRDVEVYVLDVEAFANWHDGGSTLAPIFASGRSALTNLNVTVPSQGRSTLLISNRYSLLTDKRVSVENVRLTCDE